MKNNVIVYPTYYTGRHQNNEAIIKPGYALDPEKYFIIVPNMFGNGLSSSPSNTPPPHGHGNFPSVTLYDNIQCQHRLVTEKFGISKIALVTGFSMGAQQTYHWAALFPDMVERILPICGCVKTSRHNYVFLEGIKATLTADHKYNNGHYDINDPPVQGMKAFGKVYAGWAYSPDFYREELYKQLNINSLPELLTVWENLFYPEYDANDLLAMLYSWANADISDNPKYQGDLEKAIKAIKAKAIIMPSATDMEFRHEDSAIEANLLPNAQLRIIPTKWGHLGGLPGRVKEDTEFIEKALKEILATPV
jgi:homoserine O-acetyltransferase